jgi:hypothetical protein
LGGHGSCDRAIAAACEPFSSATALPPSVASSHAGSSGSSSRATAACTVRVATSICITPAAVTNSDTAPPSTDVSSRGNGSAFACE